MVALSTLMFVSFLVRYSLQANILVTGGAGFIGYHLSLHLREEGHSVVVLDNFNSDYDVTLKKTRSTKLDKLGATVHAGDACDKPLLLNLFKTHSFDTVVHLASRTSLAASISDPISLAHSNMECQLVILQLLKQYKSTRLVYISSSDTIPDHTSSLTPPPRNLIAAMKMASLETSIKFCSENSLNIIGVRPFAVYGPWGRPDEDVYKIASSIYENLPVEIFRTSAGEVFGRDYVFVEDVVKSIYAAINYPSMDTCNKIINVGRGELVTMETVANLLETQMNKKANMEYKPLPIYEMDSVIAVDDGSDMQNLGPKVSLEEGIKRFVDWFVDYKGKKLSYNEPNHSLKDKVENEYVKQRNKETFERLRKLKEKYSNYLVSKGRPTALLFKEKTYIEKKGKYVSGGDGARVITSRNIQEMKEVCGFVDECVGFTSDGHLKQYIAPESHWSSRPGQSIFLADIDVCKAGIHNCYGNATCTYLGPAQFKCGCVEGWSLVDSNHCVELYRKGHETEVEKEQRIGDKMIARNWIEFSKNADFIPFKSKESPEGNLAFYPQAKGNVEMLKAACLASYHCMGFNTNGLLKKIIRRPSKWKSSSGTLYVLDLDYCHMSLSCPRGKHCRKMSPGKYDCA